MTKNTSRINRINPNYLIFSIDVNREKRERRDLYIDNNDPPGSLSPFDTRYEYSRDAWRALDFLRDQS